MKSAYELAMERLGKASPTVKLTDVQKKGIVVYLRSLTPAPQTGSADFGGAFARDGGGVQPTGDDGGGGSDDASSDAATPVVDAGTAADAASE